MITKALKLQCYFIKRTLYAVGFFYFLIIFGVSRKKTAKNNISKVPINKNV